MELDENTWVIIKKKFFTNNFIKFNKYFYNMNYLQNKLYCLSICLIIFISFIILNPININGQTDNDSKR